MRTKAQRRRAYRAGRWAEAIYVGWLRITGHRILARNWRSPVGEIDIIARRRNSVRIIEVKRRADRNTAAHATGYKQRLRISRAASLFLARNPDLAACDMRFDVVLISPWRPPRLVRHAWLAR